MIKSPSLRQFLSRILFGFVVKAEKSLLRCSRTQSDFLFVKSDKCIRVLMYLKSLHTCYWSCPPPAAEYALSGDVTFESFLSHSMALVILGKGGFRITRRTTTSIEPCADGVVVISTSLFPEVPGSRTRFL